MSGYPDWTKEESDSMPRIKFLTSGTLPEHYVTPDKPEIALAGRSNAGKSSLINAIANQQVAKVSQVPGKTITLNFFDVGESYRFVDMPGYGFSKRSGDEQVTWEHMVETYLNTRENLIGLLLIMDCRRKWDDDEKMLLRWVNKNKIRFAVVLTKSDKLKKAELKKILEDMKKSSRVSEVFLVSSESKAGILELEETLFETWVKPALRS